MIRFVEEQKQKAYSCFLDILICAGVVTNSRSEEYCSWGRSLACPDGTAARYCKEAAKTIANAVCRRTFNFKEIDGAFDTLYSRSVVFGETPTADKPYWQARNTKTLPKFVAFCCGINGIYWDDTAYTEEERKAIREDSVFAQMLYEAECFASQPSRVARTRAASTSGAAAGGAPKSGYKSAGPQSANVVGLIGAPGEKTLAGGTVYAIIGPKAGTIVPNAFIHPVNNPDAGEKAKVNSDGLPIVKFGAGNGYTDLTIYSTDLSQMERIQSSLKASGAFEKYGGTATIMGYRPNPGGYFRVNTEFGEVLVKPTKLNEKLFEEVFEAMKATEAEPLQEEAEDELTEANKITDIKEFYKDYKRYDC